MNTKKPPLETRVVKKILERLRSRGGFWTKIHGSPMQISGIPDIVGCYKGQYIAFEVKRDASGKPTKLQEFTMSRIRRAGGVALLIHSVQQAEAELDRIDELQEARARNHD